MESDLLSVRTNTAAMKAATAVTMAQRSIETSMERLSTGKRLNSAADDAAGVAIASRLNARLRGTNQSIRNAMDAQALVDTAEGAMQETEALLQRIRELAVQAASDTNSTTDRASLETEKSELFTEIDRIAGTTSWAGQILLDGTFTSKSFQVGGGTMAVDAISTSLDNFDAETLGLSGVTSSTTTTTTATSTISHTTPVKDTDVGELRINTGSGTGGTSSRTEKNVAKLSDGGFIVSWTEYSTDGSGQGIFARRYGSDGSTVGSQFQVNTYSTGDQFGATVAGLSDGGFVVTWQSNGQDSTTSGIYAQRYDSSSNKVGSEFRVNSSSSIVGSSDYHKPSVTALQSGKYAISWSESDNVSGSGAGSKTKAKIYSSSNSLVGSEITVSQTSTYDQNSIAELNDGSFLVGYYRSDGMFTGGAIGIATRRYDANGNALTAETLATDRYSTIMKSKGLDITALTGGGYVMAYNLAEDGYNEGTVIRIFNSSGVQVGSTIEVHSNSYAFEKFDKACVTALNDGGFVVGYQHYGQTGGTVSSALLGQRYDANGNTVGSTFQLNSEAAGSETSPSLVGLDNGRFLGVWHSGYSGNNNLNGQIFLTSSTANTTYTTTNMVSSAPVSLLSQSTASNSLSIIDTALVTLNAKRAALGSLSNRLDHIIANNTNIAANIAKSISRIEDADFAAETTNLAKQQILQQASIAMLAQANASKQNILTLLQG